MVADSLHKKQIRSKAKSDTKFGEPLGVYGEVYVSRERAVGGAAGGALYGSEEAGPGNRLSRTTAEGETKARAIEAPAIAVAL